MGTRYNQTGMKPLETWTLSVGFILSGLAIAITGVSYILNSPFPIRGLVWLIGVAFVAVGLLTAGWSMGLRSPSGVPKGVFRYLLLFSIPVAYILSSQVCGIGTSACNIACHVINFAMIVLAVVIVVQLSGGRSVGFLLVPLVIISLIPHCVCLAPINTLWHRFLGGFAPTCEMIPLAATLFAVSALKGVRSRMGAALIVVLFVVMVFIIVGGLLFGFPWRGCVGHPGVGC